jgi:APA family basic amino acid/polyamine antiporter
MLTFTIAHVAVIVLRFSEPERDRPYRMPLAVRIGGGSVPLPAVVGALLAAAGWVSIVVLHAGARNVGSAWMAFGIALYVVYRLTEGKPLLKRVTIPAKALVKEVREAEYGSILVPLLGTPLDDDIMQTAGRLARDEADAEPGEDKGARIEALWIFQIPLALPLDAALPDSQVQAASRALAHAKEVGEEYGGVEVSTAKVRSRRIGQAIVEQAKRLGVEVIVLGAAPPSRIRSGALLGGRGGPLDNYVSDVTRYVIDKAPCRVILTAPPAEDGAAPLPDASVPATDTDTNSSADPGAS